MASTHWIDLINRYIDAQLGRSYRRRFLIARIRYYKELLPFCRKFVCKYPFYRDDSSSCRAKLYWIDEDGVDDFYRYMIPKVRKLLFRREKPAKTKTLKVRYHKSKGDILLTDDFLCKNGIDLKLLNTEKRQRFEYELDDITQDYYGDEDRFDPMKPRIITNDKRQMKLFLKDARATYLAILNNDDENQSYRYERTVICYD